MRLDKKREEELAQRKGLTKRTIAQLLFFGAAIVAAFFLSRALFAEGLLTRSRMLGVFPFLRELPDWAPQAVVIIGLVIVIQFLFTLVYFVFAADAWQKVDQGSMYSRHKDPYDDYR